MLPTNDEAMHAQAEFVLGPRQLPHDFLARLPQLSIAHQQNIRVGPFGILHASLVFGECYLGHLLSCQKHNKIV